MKYKCINCNYETDVKCNFEKHNKSEKHLQKEQEIKKSANSKPIVSQSSTLKVQIEGIKYKCKYCDMAISCKQSLSKRHKICSEKDNIKKENDNLKRENNALKEQLNEIKDDKKSLRIIAENSTEANKSSASALSFVMKNYKNAPAIETFSNFQLLLEHNETHSVADVAISYFKKKELSSFIGNILIKQYIKANPKDQPAQMMWNG